MLLSGKTALITGGAGRLGIAIARTMRAEGARIVLTDLRIDSIEQGIGEAFACDLTDEASVLGMVDKAESTVSPIDILVNSAGLFPNTPFLDLESGEWDKVFAVNVRGPMLMTRTLARRWVARGSGGSVVNLSSLAGRISRPGATHYSASKAALNMMTENFAAELGPHGIRVNAVSPGVIMDDVVEKGQSGLHPYVSFSVDATPLGRTGTPQQIADAVVFLASDKSEFTTGAILDVSGGLQVGRANAPLTRTMSMVQANIQ